MEKAVYSFKMEIFTKGTSGKARWMAKAVYATWPGTFILVRSKIVSSTEKDESSMVTVMGGTRATFVTTKKKERETKLTAMAIDTRVH